MLQFLSKINPFKGKEQKSSQPLVREAADIVPFPEPKVKPGSKAKPSWMTSTSMPDTAIRVPDRNVASTDISRYSRTQGTRAILRELAHVSPDLSASVGAYLRTAITKDYFAVAKNPDGTFNREGTELAWQLLNRFDLIPDFSVGFVGPNSMRTNSESLGKELLLYGAMGAELVLDKSRLPIRIEPVTVTNVTFKPRGDRLIPVQTVGGTDFELDVPTYFYTTLDKELMEVYPSSPLESAIKPSFFNEEFMADLQRVVKRSIHPRLQVVIDEESVRKYAPVEAQHDTQAMEEYLDGLLTQVETTLNNLNPEDAIVSQGAIKISLMNNGNISLNKEWEALEQITNAKMATGAKVLPAILGHAVGSSNVASTETMLFMKNVEGMIQAKLNELYSRMLTLAVRLFGLDCYVEFWYQPIDLRPDSELEAFKAQKQSRILELLSIGMLTDEEACLQLTGFLPPATMKPLSGTMFRSQEASTETGYEGESNSGSALNQNLQSDAPTSARGQNNKRNTLKE